ncbi:uncharacterized protein LOC125532239 [Triticum urartu]|uniref:uncharacterized protein LOC125532239 n=1 Tax=Triticum urartu TaxID=4572 RepID=UPI002042EB11|nr:uncharacterized protein LOC125532239 [Triticum urartu]
MDMDSPRSRSPLSKKKPPPPPPQNSLSALRPRRSSVRRGDGALGDEAGADIGDARARQAVDPEEEEVLAANADVVDVAKLEEAATEATRRARQHRQITIEDIPRFCIELGVTNASFHRMMMKRRRRMLDICSLKLWGHPVTPPIVDGRDTFHIVEILSGKDSVEILFRESDLYFVGFRPRPAGHNDDPRFYLFNDVVTPKWPEWLPYHTLSYDSGYGSIVAGITVGRHCFPSIFTKLLDFNPENYKTKNKERKDAFHWTMIMLSETLRIRPVQQMVERTLDTGTVEQIGKSLDKKIHNWARNSRDAFADVSSNDINWELIGCDGDLLTLKFSEEEALPVIIVQQNKVEDAAAVALTDISSLIKIHFTANCQQLPKFHSYLIFLLASEKGISVKVKQAVGLLLKSLLLITEATGKICEDFPEDFRDDADLSELPIQQRLLQLFKYPYVILRKLADVKNPDVLSHMCKAFAGLKDIRSEGLPSKVCHVLNDLKQLGGMISGADAFPP